MDLFRALACNKWTHAHKIIYNPAQLSEEIGASEQLRKSA